MALTPAVEIPAPQNGSKGGRPQAFAREELIEAIRKWRTSSPTTLAERMGCERTAVWRALKKIPPEEIQAILTPTDKEELKPGEMEWEVFLELPDVKKYHDELISRQVSPKFLSRNLRGIWGICVALKCRPRFDPRDPQPTIEEVKGLLTSLLKGESFKVGKSYRMKVDLNRRSYDNLRLIARNWFYSMGIKVPGSQISGELSAGFGKMSSAKLTREQRAQFIQTLGALTDGSPVWLSLPKFQYYTGTRAKACLDAQIQDINPPLTQPSTIHVIQLTDKGRHKEGRITWFKPFGADLAQALRANLESRGNPTSGPLFDEITYEEARETYRKAYAQAGIEVEQPNHIWRHTAAQDMLDATDWNLELTARTLGWESTDALKKSYGKMPDTKQKTGLLKAMGLQVEETKAEFKF